MPLSHQNPLKPAIERYESRLSTLVFDCAEWMGAPAFPEDYRERARTAVSEGVLAMVNRIDAEDIRPPTIADLVKQLEKIDARHGIAVYPELREELADVVGAKLELYDQLLHAGGRSYDAAVRRLGKKAFITQITVMNETLETYLEKLKGSVRLEEEIPLVSEEYIVKARIVVNLRESTRIFNHS